MELADGMLLAAGAGTAQHSRDVERIALGIADRLGLSGNERQKVGVAARLHDIGKVAIPRAVLEKTAPPTKKEWELIYSHTVVGERILRSVEELRAIAAAVRHSHERWDGAGYPDGLRGLEIPLASRIIFCADAFHAICTDRPYRRGRSMAEALAEIRQCAGTQFEPRVVAALTRLVRNDIYGEMRRPRRRSHARLSMLLVVALSLGGSIAGGMAASRDAGPGQGLASQSAGALAPVAGGLQLVPDLTPKGSVAGAFARAERDGTTRLDPQPTGGDSEPTVQPPTAPAKEPQSTGPTVRVPPVGPPIVNPPSIREIGSRLGISPGGEGGQTEAGGGDSSAQKDPNAPPAEPESDRSLSPLG